MIILSGYIYIAYNVFIILSGNIYCRIQCFLYFVRKYVSHIMFSLFCQEKYIVAYNIFSFLSIVCYEEFFMFRNFVR
jgi:hypothetical protein